MKKGKIVISIILCMILCMNLVPVYGSDSGVAEPQEAETVEVVIEETDNLDNEADITVEPEDMPLTPPAGLKAVHASGKNVKLTWNSVLGATGYEVYRCLYKNGKYKYHNTVKGTSYIDKKAYAGECFYYKVRAVNADNNTLNSELSVSTSYCTKPAAPVISAKNNNGQINVSWKKVYGAQKYHVFVFNKTTGKYMKIGETEKLTYTHKKARKNVFLNYKVKAVYVQEGKTISGNLSNKFEVLSRYVNPNKKMVALTFDDGPSAHTKAIVDCLFKNNSAATFFVVGNRIDSYKDTVKHTYKMGCELANHSYSHPILTGLTAKQIKSEINKTDNKVKALTGQKTALLRAPGGGYNSTVKKAAGKPLIQWSDDTLDWKTRSKSATVNYVMKNVQDGDIVLMHDLHEPTKEAALELIPKLKKKGYQIVTVSELAKYKGYDLKNGTVYFSFR